MKSIIHLIICSLGHYVVLWWSLMRRESTRLREFCSRQFYYEKPRQYSILPFSRMLLPHGVAFQRRIGIWKSNLLSRVSCWCALLSSSHSDLRWERVTATDAMHLIAISSMLTLSTMSIYRNFPSLFFLMMSLGLHLMILIRAINLSYLINQITCYSSNFKQKISRISQSRRAVLRGMSLRLRLLFFASFESIKSNFNVHISIYIFIHLL